MSDDTLAAMYGSDRRDLERVAAEGKVPVADLAAAMLEHHLAAVRQSGACLDGTPFAAVAREARSRRKP